MPTTGNEKRRAAAGCLIKYFTLMNGPEAKAKTGLQPVHTEIHGGKMSPCEKKKRASSSRDFIRRPYPVKLAVTLFADSASLMEIKVNVLSSSFD